MLLRSWWIALVLAWPCMLVAQELEPRALSPGPVGLNIAAVSASYSTGDLVFDSSLPLEDVTAKIAIGGVGYQRFFGLAGMTAKFAVAAAWADAHAKGYVEDLYRERDFAGLTDPRIAMSVIFAGAPAMTPAQYAQYKPRTVAGFSVSVSPPLGAYESDKLLNVGTNRWTLRTQLGASHYTGPWTFEGTLGGQFFTENDNFFGGSSLEQDPILSVQAHCAYTVRPQFWIAASATYYRGGESTVNGVTQPGFQSNSRYGLSTSVPLKHRQSLNFHFSRGLSTRLGSNYQTIAATWGVRWLDK